MKSSTLSKARAAVLALVVFTLASFGSLRASFAQPVTPPEEAADASAADTDADAGAAPLEPSEPVVVAPDAGAPEVAPASPAPAAPRHETREDKKEEARSTLVPSIDARQQAKRPIDPAVTFRPGKGLSVSSADGQFELTMGVRGQILGTVERDHGPGGETLHSVEIRRARLNFQGHFFGKHNKYKFQLGASPRDVALENGVVGDSPLFDWYMTFDHLKEATVVVGQYKVPFSRQRVVSSGGLQMVDRSIVQAEFNLDRSVGLDVRSTSLLDGHVHYFAGVYGSEGRNASALRDGNIVYLARAELLPFGKFEDYVEADFERTGPRLSIGGSYAHISNSMRNQGPLGAPPADGGTTTFNTAEADVLLKMYGLSATGEVFWREGDRKLGDAVDDSGAPIPMERPRDGYGGFGQLGYLLPHTMFEVSSRYGMMRRSSAEKSSLQNRQELGGALSYYFVRHTLKLQADYFRLWTADRLAEGLDQVRLQLEAGF